MQECPLSHYWTSPLILHHTECQLSLDHACRLLGLDATSLVTSLTFRRITASHSKRQSVFMKPCSMDEAGVRRDCLAKVIYARWVGQESRDLGFWFQLYYAGMRFLLGSADFCGFWKIYKLKTLECIKIAVFDTRNPKSSYRGKGVSPPRRSLDARSIRFLAKLSSSFFKYFLSHIPDYMKARCILVNN